MNYNIIELTRDKLEKSFDSFIETLENLKPSWDIDKQKILSYFDEANKTSRTFIIEKEDWEIIWCIKVLIEYKLIRWWVKAAKIEDVAVKEWYQWKWLWWKLMEKALEYSEKQWVYKVTLSCRDEILPFYEKYWFKKYSTNMKKYLY